MCSASSKVALMAMNRRQSYFGTAARIFSANFTSKLTKHKEATVSKRPELYLSKITSDLCCGKQNTCSPPTWLTRRGLPPPISNQELPVAITKSPELRIESTRDANEWTLYPYRRVVRKGGPLAFRFKRRRTPGTLMTARTAARKHFNGRRDGCCICDVRF